MKMDGWMDECKWHITIFLLQSVFFQTCIHWFNYWILQYTLRQALYRQQFNIEGLELGSRGISDMTSDLHELLLQINEWSLRMICYACHSPFAYPLHYILWYPQRYGLILRLQWCATAQILITLKEPLISLQFNHGVPLREDQRSTELLLTYSLCVSCS